MRIGPITTVALFCTTTAAFADPELTLSVGVMERSVTQGTTILVDFSTRQELLNSDALDASGLFFEAQILDDGMWGRALTYSDDFNQRVTGVNGIAFQFSNNIFGLSSPNSTVDFTHETGLTRLDFMTEVAQVSGIDVYAGGSLVRMTDDLGGRMQDGFNIGTFAWEGSTQMVGAVLGARHDYAPSAGSSGFTLSTFGTLGLYHAAHSMDFSFDLFGTEASAEETGVTTAAEIGISLGYAFSENSEVSLTYQAALYGDAIDAISAPGATLTPGATTTQATTNSVFYQGLSASYVFRF